MIQQCVKMSFFMDVQSSSSSFMVSTKVVDQRPERGIIDWKQYRFHTVNYNTQTSRLTQYRVLKGTSLSCREDNDVAKWENRQAFLERILAETLAQCPKADPLAIVSLGSERLLSEAILGRELMKRGFKDISFLMVDPSYFYSAPEHLSDLKKACQDFRQYLGVEESKIEFLSRAQNAQKYFREGANVVFIESLPPYSQIIAEIKKCGLPDVSPADLFVGGKVVPETEANAVAFIPDGYYSTVVEMGAKLTDIPICIFRDSVAKKNFYIDWGCKIRPDGTVYTKFSDSDLYLASLGVPTTRSFRLVTGDTVPILEWIPRVQKAVEAALKEMQSDKAQTTNADLLKKAQTVAVQHITGLHALFLADYTTDCTQLLGFLAEKAGTFAKRFLFNCSHQAPGFEIAVIGIK